jgi:hypothetical protein
MKCLDRFRGGGIPNYLPLPAHARSCPAIPSRRDPEQPTEAINPKSVIDLDFAAGSGVALGNFGSTELAEAGARPGRPGEDAWMRAIEATAYPLQPAATLVRRDSLPAPTYPAVRRQLEIRDHRREALYSPITADVPNRGSAVGSSSPSSIVRTSRVCSPFRSDLRKVTKVATSPITHVPRDGRRHHAVPGVPDGAPAPRHRLPAGPDPGPSPGHFMKPPVASPVPLVVPPRQTRRAEGVCPLGPLPARRGVGLPSPPLDLPPVPAREPIVGHHMTLPFPPGFRYNPHSL